MKLFARPIRLIHIYFVLMRYNILELIVGKHQFYPLRFLNYLNPYYWLRNKNLPRGERVRLAVVELGPIFIKAAQIISTRRDFIPDDISASLAQLQDRVPPFSGKKAKSLIEKSLHHPIETIFSEFDTQALASASIAQVHAARFHNGDSVVIKVLRPNIRKLIDRDIGVLQTLAKIAEYCSAEARQLKPQQLILEVAQTLHDELDLMREAANASQLKRNFQNSPLVHVPKIYWEFTHPQIMVMERIHGVPIHDIEQLHRLNVDMKMLAKRGIELFFTQIFRDSFFHADLHPGNIFVCVDDPCDPTYIFVDFGIVGSLNQHDQRYLAENLLAFFKRDYQRVAELHIACGWVPPDTRIDLFEGAIRAVSEPIFEQPLKEVSFGKLLLRLFQVAHRFHIEIQPQLLLLQKTLMNIESLSRSLDPELDIWQTATPQIQKWLRKQVGVKSFLKRIRQNMPLWSQQLPELPTLIYEVLSEKKQRQEAYRFKHTQAKTTHCYYRFAYFLTGVLITSATFLLLK